MSEYKNFHDWQAEKAPLIARVVRAEAEVERLRAVSDELQGWRDRAVASCIKRRCDSRDRRAGELETEVERLRAAAPIIHTLDVDDLVREVGRKVDAWTHDGSSHHDLKAACAEAIRKTAPEVASAPALPDNADPGDEAQPASPTDEGVAHAYASHLREARAARAILEAPLLARIAELEQIRQDAITGLGRIDRALGAGGAK